MMRVGRRHIADEAALLLMAQFNARLTAEGSEPNDRAAARHAVALLGIEARNVLVGSIEDRLRRKFSERRAELMAVIGSAEFSPIKSQDTTFEAA